MYPVNEMKQGGTVPRKSYFSHAIPMLAKDTPLYKAVAHRRYRNIPGYLDQEEVVSAFAVGQSGALADSLSDADFHQGATLRAVSNMAEQYDMPIYAVGPEILAMAAMTTPPSAMRVSELQLPFPSVTFLLPEGAFPTPFDDIRAVSICATMSDGKDDFRPPEPGQLYNVFICGLSREMADNESVGYCPRNWYTILRSDFTMGESKDMDSVIDTTSDVIRLTEAKQVSPRLIDLVVNLICIMNTEPNLVEDERLLRKSKGSGKKQKPELWQRRWVEMPTRKESLDTCPKTGSHASPRTHWRRGHWRRLGEGKMIWIRPMLVNAKGEL